MTLCNRFCFKLIVRLVLTLFFILHGDFIGKSSNAKSIENYMSVTKAAGEMPKAAKKPTVLTLHNDARIDNYAWLRDPKWPEISNPEILNYLNEEKKYTEKFFKSVEKVKKKLYREMESRIPKEDSSYPVRIDDYEYFDRVEKGKNYKIHFRRSKLTKREEILIDENELAKGSTFFKLGLFELSHDQQLIAFSQDKLGQERYELRIKDLKTNKFIPDVLENVSGETVIWHKKLKGFFYVALNEKLRADRVYFHILGESQTKDKLIYQEKDETFSVGLKYSSDRTYLFLETSRNNTQEHYYIQLEQEDLTPKVLIPRKEGHLYVPDYLDGYFYFLTNDKGSNFRLIKAACNDLKFDEAVQVVEHSVTKYIVNFYLYKNFLVYKLMENGIPKIKIRDIKHNNAEIEVPFNEDIYDANIEFTRYEDPFLRIKYSSLATPETIFEYHFESAELHRRKTKQVLGGFNAQEYKVERLGVPSKDGKTIPISLVYKKSLKKSEGNPLLLYGYGSYGLGVETKFVLPIISLLDRGFIYAIAHIRGGDELGYDWYNSAKLLAKKLSFDDFIDASEYLINKGYTVKKNIAITGRSAGGMLMGYCANERPDLYRAIVAGVPFVDVLNTMLDENLPLTPGEYTEWGNPKDEKFYHYIKSYSPYDNVRAQEYPHMYVTAGLNDPRVTYWEPAKWVAKLRECKTDQHLLLLDINMGSGHFSDSGLHNVLKDDYAKMYAFLLTVFDIEKPEVEKGFVETCRQIIIKIRDRIKNLV